MKISTCQFNDSYFPIIDGVGMTVHNYALWMHEKYGKSCVIAPNVKGYKDMDPYPVYRFKSMLIPGMNPYRIGLPQLDVNFRHKLKLSKFDLVHAHSPFISGHLALRMAKKKGIPVIATFHSKYREDFRKVLNNDALVDFFLKVMLEFYHSVDHVWVPNKATGNTLVEYGYQGHLDVVPNGTDFEIPDKTTHQKLRRKGLDLIDAGPREFVMLFVGQHRWEKNVRMIIESMKILSSSGEHFKMVFAGEGYAADEMKEMVRKLNLTGCIRFTGIIPERQKLKSLYAASDLFVFPSEYDNSPLVMQEAAAFEVPSMLLKGSSPSEGIMDGINGFLVDNDPKEMAMRISDLMKHPARILKAGEGARKTIHKPWEDIVDEVFLRYAGILKEHPGKETKGRKKISAG